QKRSDVMGIGSQEDAIEEDVRDACVRHQLDSAFPPQERLERAAGQVDLPAQAERRMELCPSAPEQGVVRELVANRLMKLERGTEGIVLEPTIETILDRSPNRVLMLGHEGGAEIVSRQPPQLDAQPAFRRAEQTVGVECVHAPILAQNSHQVSPE